MLTAGRDYLFFEKADCTKQSLTATMTRGAAVLTPNLIAMIPVESFGTILVAPIVTKYGKGQDPVATVKAMLADPAMDLATLERTLIEIYMDAGTRWIFPLADLETFKVTTGFWGMTSLKVRGESIRRLVIRDKGGKAAAKEFYASALAARA